MFNMYMATQVISPAAFATLCAEVADAIAAGNYATAASKYAQAQAVHLGLLNSTISTQADSISRFQSLSALREAIKFASELNADEDESRFIIARTKH